MQGISPKLPLIKDEIDGVYSLNKTIIETVKQNFKNVLLTIPGERVMDPEFGVGLKKYLFEPFNRGSYADIEAAIHEQSEMYLPFIKVLDVSFKESERTPEILSVHVEYEILPLGRSDVLVLNSDSN
tara:strand:- start:9042 stop:9422 length:381 start_codon:yes stop_codon:yes gene_type:complete